MLMKWCSKVSPISAISSGKQEPQMKSDWHSQIYVFNDWYALMRLSSKTSFLFSCITFKLKSESQVPWLFTVLITRFSSLVQCITSDFKCHRSSAAGTSWQDYSIWGVCKELDAAASCFALGGAWPPTLRGWRSSSRWQQPQGESWRLPWEHPASLPRSLRKAPAFHSPLVLSPMAG